MTGSEVRVERAGDGDGPEWRRFLAGSGAAEVGHRWEVLAVLREVFRLEVVRLVASREGRWLAVLPLALQRSFLGTFVTSVPYFNYAGILGEDGEARAALAREALAVAEGALADRIEIRGREGSGPPLDAWTGKASYRLPLDGGVEGVRKALGAKVRAQVKRPLREGFSSRIAGPGECGRFYALLARKWHELGSPILPRTFFEKLEERLGSDVAYVLVERNGRASAAGLLLRNGTAVEIPWAASAREHDRFGVNMMLYGAAIEHAAATGARSSCMPAWNTRSSRSISCR